jgi:PAS domain-containing protein
LASSFGKLILLESLPLFQDLLNAIWEGKPYYEGEGKIQTIDGLSKFIALNVAFLTGGSDLKRVLIIGNDITQRKLAEAALRESEEKYRRIVDTANEGMWALDDQLLTTFDNNRISELIGYER